jgi:hypothetical protein
MDEKLPPCSIIKSIKLPRNKKQPTKITMISYIKPNPDKKAGDGNRTHMTSLEGWGFTIKLRPHYVYLIQQVVKTTHQSQNCQRNNTSSLLP